MAPDESPGSSLSDIDSDTFTEDPKFDSRSRDDTISVADSQSASTPLPMPPAKRRRTGASAYDHATPHSITTGADEALRVPHSPSGSISSDTSGDVPNSPSFAHLGIELVDVHWSGRGRGSASVRLSGAAPRGTHGAPDDKSARFGAGANDIDGA